MSKNLLIVQLPASLALTILTLSAVFVHATQASFDIFDGRTDIHLNVCLVDALIWTAFPLWAWKQRNTGKFSALKVSALSLIGAAWLLLSLIPSLKGKPYDTQVMTSLGVIKLAQFVEYFIIAYILFLESFRYAKYRQLAVALLAAAILLNVAAAWSQYVTNSVGVTGVRGMWFANRNTFGAFLALGLPLIFGHAVFSSSKSWLISASALVVAGIAVVLAGGPWIALCLGVLIVAELRGRVAFLVTVGAILVLTFLILPHTPRHNTAVLRDSVALYKESDPYHLFRGSVDTIQNRLVQKQKNIAEKALSKTPVAFADLLQDDNYTWKWQQRYKEMQAATNMIARSPVFGVGAGSYQANIDRFYLEIPKYPQGLLEPDTLSGYFVWAASAGIPFMLIMFALLMRAASRAMRSIFTPLHETDRGVAAGILGSIVALTVSTVFTDPLVRGVGITLVLVIALAESLQLNSTESQSAT